jgi:hypothetical protein
VFDETVRWISERGIFEGGAAQRGYDDAVMR